MSQPLRRIHSITGLSDRFQIPRIGKIRLGVRTQGPKGLTPKEVPHFVVPPEVARLYGPEPTALPIMFPLDDRSIIFPQAYTWYGASNRMKCRGDGQGAIRRWAEVEPALQQKLGGAHQPNDLVEIPCPCSRLDPKSKQCTPKANLMFFLPEVSLTGVYQIDTPSIANIIRINSALTLLRSLLGRLAMIPFTLRREPVKMPHNGTLQTHYLLSLTFDGDLRSVEQIRGSVASSVPVAALPPVPAARDQGTPAPPAEATAPPPVPPTLMLAQSDASPAGRTPGHPAATPTPPTPRNGRATAPETGAPTTRLVPPLAPVDTAVHPPPHRPTGERPAPTQRPPTPPAGARPAASAGGATDRTAEAAPRCACGVRVTARIAEYSQRHFGQTLCIPCQKQRPGASKDATL